MVRRQHRTHNKNGCSLTFFLEVDQKNIHPNQQGNVVDCWSQLNFNSSNKQTGLPKIAGRFPEHNG